MKWKNKTKQKTQFRLEDRKNNCAVNVTLPLKRKKSILKKTKEEKYECIFMKFLKGSFMFKK